MARRYCWRVGAAFEIGDGEKCIECGSADHRPVAAGTCGDFVTCGDHGHPCWLSPGHGGHCQSNGCPAQEVGR